MPSTQLQCLKCLTGRGNGHVAFDCCTDALHASAVLEVPLCHPAAFRQESKEKNKRKAEQAKKRKAEEAERVHAQDAPEDASADPAAAEPAAATFGEARTLQWPPCIPP